MKVYTEDVDGKSIKYPLNKFHDGLVKFKKEKRKKQKGSLRNMKTVTALIKI